MKLPLNWLRDYIKVNITPKELADIFTSIGYMLDEPVVNETISLEVRQNRADCLSVVGLARELSAATGVAYSEPKLLSAPLSSKVNSYLKIENPEKLNSFCALHIKTKVAETSKYIRDRLESIGIPSINNIVDITNFVMLELGQPMHAFDLKKGDGGKLVVRNAKEKERFETLLGSKLNLDGGDLVIADENKVIGLAGIIGGKNSNCENTSSELLIEAANYNQAGVRKSSRKHNIRTEASTRLEKFLSPALPEIAIKRFLQILTDEKIPFEILGYEDFLNFPKTPNNPNILFNLQQIVRLGGVTLAKKEVIKILTSLNIKYQETSEELFELEIPYYRTDLALEEDIVEEVLRIYGYEKIPSLPINIAPPKKETVSAEYILEDKIRSILVEMGFDEHITDPLIKKQGLPHEIVLENCLNEDKNALRTLIPLTLQPILDNYKKHKIDNRKIFEVGKIYLLKDGKYEEVRVATALCGEEIPFEELKGYAELLLDKLDISGVDFVPTEEGANITQNNTLLGKISPNSFSFYVNSLVQAVKTPTQYAKIEMRNRIVENITINLPKEAYVGKIVTSIKAVSDKVDEVVLVEIFEKEDTKAITLRIFYWDKTKPLSDKDILPIRTEIAKKTKELSF